jgi:two-component system sensor histidine kinase KdpD
VVNRAEVARQSEELKSTLLDAIAHEFKSPLTSIKAVTTDLLDSESRLPPADRELISIADEGADRLSRLVTEAIQLARIEGGKFPLNREPHFPRSLISEAVREMKPLTESRQISIQIPDAVPGVFADADLVKMVLRLLIDNALKYSPTNTPILIEAGEQDGLVVITVSDQGPGIPAEEQHRIFEKFHRYLKDHPHTSGTGMGLAIAREILRLHGGEIWVKSTPGAGSHFQFSLPIAPAEKMI